MAEAVHALDACGYDLILLETVGVGQSEVAVMDPPSGRTAASPPRSPPPIR
ncbi:hypothetical protein NE659_27660 [Flavonifractor plautii]|uniref:hypothetical protein n=1 Tax=Flavonifractor plautii TaxID=292800 RepID=UPI00210933BF|nr:hypothetical protein [Flavonifractor plautii]MCQ4721028.1 hypothetical protein [Flavonifractor plautii]